MNVKEEYPPTSGWTNIPQCITQAINILLEKITSNSTEIEDLKESLTDLTIKFQVKTSRMDTSIQEHTSTLKSSLPQISDDINTLKAKTDSIIISTDSKLHPITEKIKELKSKTSTISSDLKRETREILNKLEKLKTDVKSESEESFERVFDRIVSAESNLLKKFQTLSYQQSSDFEEMSKKFESVQEKLKIVNFQFSQQNENFCFLNERIEKFEEGMKMIKEQMEDIEKDHDSTKAVIESLIQPPPPPQSFERKKTVNKTETVVNPIFSRIKEVEDNLEELQAKWQDLLSDQVKLSKNELNETRNQMEAWTLESIHKAIASHTLQLKEKLEWLPDSSSSLKGMPITEARLFLLESRLRSEEKQRILNDKLVLDLLTEVKTKTQKNFDQRRASLSPSQAKNSTASIDRKPLISTVPNKRRPSSSYQQRDVSSQDKLRERLLVKV
jgi:uncharacterized protein YoxC